MMKKLLALVTIALGLALADKAGAGSNGVNGTLLGAGSGALIGQALGRNTESTVVGTAVGAMIGYALDNGVARGPSYGYQPRMVVVRPENQQTCREMEMLATIDGYPEKVYGLACWQDGVWVRIEEDRPQPIVYRPVIIHEEYRVGRGYPRYVRYGGGYRRWAREESHDRHERYDDHRDRRRDRH
ncbi:MAG: glycine zipper family protein [Desulfobulbaceae bacterium]|nr:glycine zipper family protein [Desulfobulbaceae bacterium]